MPALDPDRITTLTFDCYGTLIDWEAGAIAALRPLLARHGVALSDDEIIAAFQDLEEPLCEPPHKAYRAVLAGVVEGFGRRFGLHCRRAERPPVVVRRHRELALRSARPGRSATRPAGS